MAVITIIIIIGMAFASIFVGRKILINMDIMGTVLVMGNKGIS